MNNSYALDNNLYTVKNALNWQLCLSHYQLSQKGTLGHRIVHYVIAAAECLPIIGQIISLMELALYHRFGKSSKPDSSEGSVVSSPAPAGPIVPKPAPTPKEDPVVPDTAPSPTGPNVPRSAPAPTGPNVPDPAPVPKEDLVPESNSEPVISQQKILIKQAFDNFNSGRPSVPKLKNELINALITIILQYPQTSTKTIIDTSFAQINNHVNPRDRKPFKDSSEITSAICDKAQGNASLLARLACEGFEVSITVTEDNFLETIQLLKQIPSAKELFPDEIAKLSDLTKKKCEEFLSITTIDTSFSLGAKKPTFNPERVQKLNDALIEIEKETPKEWELGKHITQLRSELFQWGGTLTQLQIANMMQSNRYNPLQKNVLSSFQFLSKFLDNRKPELEDFIDCFDKIYEHLKTDKDHLETEREKDLLLNMLLSVGASLVEQAGAHIKLNKLDQIEVDFRNTNTQDLAAQLDECCLKTPTLFGTTVEFETEMNTENDELLTLLETRFPNLDTETLNAWINEHESEPIFPDYKVWLQSNLQNPQFIDHDLDGLYLQYSFQEVE